MIRAAVIGAGAMGRHHVRVYSDLPNVDLVGVADANPDALSVLGRRYHGPIFADHRRLLEETQPDLVSIAVPTSLHARVARDAIRAGCHVLVEKPIASTVVEGQSLIEAAQAQGVWLAVGHIERCNPAVIELKRWMDQGKLGQIFQIHARRWSPYPSRITDVGVGIDLATHDIDVMRFLTGAQVLRLHAEIDHRTPTAGEDLLSGLLRFDNGSLGVLDINWLAPLKVRELTVFGEKGMARVDYLTQDVYIYSNRYVDSNWDSLRLFKGVGEGEMVRLYLEKREPLQVEIEDFVQLVAGERPRGRLASGEDGLAALDIAQRLIAAGRAGRVEVLNRLETDQAGNQ